MDSGPLVSVIMPVFNSERFVEQAVQSVLAQSYGNFECIIVDDGSSDRSGEILEGLQKTDPRIHLICLAKNQGVSNASNLALQAAQGKYIARMDADDVSLPDRFLLQVSFLEAHPEVGILGTGMRYMDETGLLLATPPMYQGDTAIRWHMMFEYTFFNPTIMIRKSVIDKLDLKYDISAIYGEEDYDFVSRLIAGTKGENLPEALLYYRLHQSSLSYRYVNERNESILRISCHAVETLLPKLSATREEIVDLIRAIQGTTRNDRQKRSRLLPAYFKLWDEFHCIHKNEPGLPRLEQEVIAWAARLILIPPFQPASFQALGQLTNKELLWPFYLISQIPYFISRRRIR